MQRWHSVNWPNWAGWILFIFRIFRKDMKIPIYVSSLALKWNLNLFRSIHPLTFTWLLKPTPSLPTVPIWMHKMATAWYHGSFSWLQSETLGAQIQVTKFLLEKTLKDFCLDLLGNSFLAFPLPSIPIFSLFPVYGNPASSPETW